MKPRLANPYPLPYRRSAWRRAVGAVHTTTYVVRTTAKVAHRTYRTTRWVVRKNVTHRRKLAPLHASLTLLALGAAAHQAPDGARTATTLTLAAALGLWAWQRRRARLRRPLTGRKLAFAWASFLTGMAWAVAAARYGLSAPMPGLLLAWTAGFGGPWWWHHRIRPHAQLVDDQDPRVADWDEHVAPIASGTTMVGSPRDIPDPDGELPSIGWEADIEVPKSKKFSVIADKTEEVAGVYDRDRVTDVSIEPTQAGSVRRGIVRVYTHHPLYRTRLWPGPDLFDPETGVAKIAMYADCDHALYRFYRRNSGPVHDLIAGTTDAGKSQLTGQLLSIERFVPWMASVIIDPQGGQSLPEFKGNVALYARSVEDGLHAIRAVHAEMYRRSDLLANLKWVDQKGRPRDGIGFFDPITLPGILASAGAEASAAALGLPLIVLTIEEAHAILAIPEAKKMVEDIGKMARKCGIKLRLIVQVPLLDQLGGSTTLRDMVVAGNTVSLRTANPLTSGVVFGKALPVDPFLIPKELPDGSTSSGLGFISGPKPRAAMCRVLYVEDMYHWATVGATTQLPEVVAFYERFKAEAEAEEALLAAAMAPTSGETVQVGGSPAADVEAKTAPARILAYLTDHGPATTSVLAVKLQLTPQNVSTACGRLEKKGQLTSPRRGMWDINREQAEAVAAEHAAADGLVA